MSMLQQPAEPPDTGEHDFLAPGYPNPFDPLHMQELLPLTTEELGVVLAPFQVDTRMAVIRDLHDTRRFHADQRRFNEEVELQRERKRARREADRLDEADREAYLTSEEGLAEAAALFEADMVDLDELPDPEPLIEGFLYRDTTARTFGPPKSLKSFVTLDMAASVSLGIPWQGHETVQTTTLYVVAEGARGVKKRRDAWNQHHQTDMKVIFYPKAVQIRDLEQMHRLIAYCRAKQVGYVIFDTQARCTVGVKENDNTEMGEIVHALDVLKQRTGACVHLVHHSAGADDSKARGATAWDGAVDAEFQVKRDRQDRTLVSVITKFQKDEAEAEPVELVTVEAGKSLALAPNGNAVHTAGGTGEVAPALVSDANAFYLETVRAFGRQAVSITDMVTELKDRGTPRSRSAVKKAFGTLEANGAITAVGSKGTSVMITEAGLVFSDQWRRREASQNAQNQGVIPGVTDT